MAVPSALEALLTAPGSPSGREAPAAEVFRAACRPLANSVTTDVNGSTVATLAGTGGGRSVAIIGHIDEIGLIVTHIDEKGFLWIEGVGGWDPIQLVGQRVTITTAAGPVHGVVGRKPIHLIPLDDRTKAPKMKDLHVDIGVVDGDAAMALVSVGDVMVLTAQPRAIGDGRLVSKALDNRLGCYVAWRTLELVSAAGGAAGDLHACAVVQEETGLAGARTTAYTLQPDVAIVVDVTHATDVPNISENENGSHGLGTGAVIFRATGLHPAVSDGLLEVARARTIAYTLEATGRGTGTDADTAAIARGGIATGLVGMPLRYMHSPTELCDLADVEACAQLCAAYVLGLPADATFER